MFKGLLLGIVLGVLLVGAAIHFYFASGQAPVAVTAAPMPFERRYAHIALDAYLNRLAHPEPQTPADETNFLAGAEVYKSNCAVCHGLPAQPKTAIAAGMFPKPPQLWKGVGVTDDEAWETYWKVENGIRMTGMPGFKGALNEAQIWQVSVLLKNADKLPASVAAALSEKAGAAPLGALPTAPSPTTSPTSPVKP
ncbi:MAG TPA: cytochrome c [Candidatus Dormibacteraeota bacterium]|jgi:mono/diheme cytochrome c family protein|nr:cytochrome c [Candidatus Dormibacteraeota bacterium]